MNSQESSLKSYSCTDGQGAIVEIQAESPRDAAQEYVDGGDWGTIDETTWIDVGVTELDGPGGEPAYNHERITITLQPEEPECSNGEIHEWESPYEVLGGLKENPGVQGNGGGVICTTVCRHCGCYQIHNTWAQRSDTGEQGLESYKYQDADKASEEWVRSLTAPEWTEEEATEWVRSHDDDDTLDDDDLDRAFHSLFGRRPNDSDREQGLWSHVCAAVSAAN